MADCRAALRRMMSSSGLIAKAALEILTMFGGASLGRQRVSEFFAAESRWAALKGCLMRSEVVDGMGTLVVESTPLLLMACFNDGAVELADG